MRDSDFYGVGGIELVPGFENTEAVAEAYIRRGQLVSAMAQTAGFKVVEARMKRARITARSLARLGSDEDADAAMANAVVFGSVCDMVEGYQFGAEFAKKNIVPERKAFPDITACETAIPAVTPEQAMREAEAFVEMTRLPGWSIWLRDVAAQMRALTELETLTRGEARAAVRNLYNAYATVLTELRDVVRRGMDAAAWQEAHTLEALREDRGLP